MRTKSRGRPWNRRAARRGGAHGPAPLIAAAALALAAAVLTGCSQQKDAPAGGPPPAAAGACVIKGFSLGMPIREAVDRVNRHYLEAFGPPRYETSHQETQRWMEGLDVKPVRVNLKRGGTREYVYDRFHVVRYRDDGREYMFPFSPFMTDGEGRVISIFLVGPMARKLYHAETLAQAAYLGLLGRELGVPAWDRVEPAGEEVYWTATVPGQCTFEVYEDKGVKLLPPGTH